MALGGEGAAMGFIRGSKQNVGWGAVGGGEALPVGEGGGGNILKSPYFLLNLAMNLKLFWKRSLLSGG